MNRKARRRLGRILWAFAACAAGSWVLLVLTGTPSIGLYGDRVGVFVRAKREAVSLDIAWGWRSADWMSRTRFRGPGDRAHRKDFFGWGVGRDVTRWNANVSTTVTWLGVQAPGWYWAIVALVPLLEPVRRARRLRRQRVRRRRRFETWLEAACPGCGYDLRASVDRCPECGRRVPVKC